MKHLSTWLLCAVIAVAPGCGSMWETPARTPEQQAQIDLQLSALNKTIRDGLAQAASLYEQYAAGQISKADWQKELAKAAATQAAAQEALVALRPGTPGGATTMELILAGIPGVLAALGAAFAAKRGDKKTAETAVHTARIEAASVVENMAPTPPQPTPQQQALTSQYLAAMGQRPAG